MNVSRETQGVVCSLTGFTLEFSLAVPHAGAAHHVTIFHLPIPLFPDAVVVAVVVTPLWMRGKKQGEGMKEEGRECEGRGGVKIEIHEEEM